MRGSYETLRIARDTAWQLPDESWPADSVPAIDEERLADDIARCMVECAALDAMIEETEEKGRAA